MRFNLILFLSMLALCSGIAQEQKICPLMIEDEIDPEDYLNLSQLQDITGLYSEANKNRKKQYI